MIAIDWSHTKELTTYDGKRARVETLKQVISRLLKDGTGEESNYTVQSKLRVHSSVAILEQGCPLSLIYRLTSRGVTVKLIVNHATEQYRREHGIEKTDENDAKILCHLANNGAAMQEVTLDDRRMQMHDLYHQYCRYQKARVAMQNMRKAHLRAYGVSGAGESTKLVKSKVKLHPAPDLSPYDISIEVLQAREKTLLKTLGVTAKGMPLFEMAGGESIETVKSMVIVQPPAIKGLGERIWLGIMVAANPTSFKCLSAYLRFCGLTGDAVKSHRYNRHARMLYHMLAEEVMRLKDPTFRPIYDQCKADIAERNPEYTKGHIHNAALNRVATFLAKEIYEWRDGNHG